MFVRRFQHFKRGLAATLHTPTYVFCNPLDYQSNSGLRGKGVAWWGSLMETVAVATSSVKSVAQHWSENATASLDMGRRWTAGWGGVKKSPSEEILEDDFMNYYASRALETEVLGLNGCFPAPTRFSQSRLLLGSNLPERTKSPSGRDGDLSPGRRVSPDLNPSYFAVFSDGFSLSGCHSHCFVSWVVLAKAPQLPSRLRAPASKDCQAGARPCVGALTLPHPRSCRQEVTKGRFFLTSTDMKLPWITRRHWNRLLSLWFQSPSSHVHVSERSCVLSSDV